MEEEDRCVVIVEAAEGAVCVRCLLSCRREEESHERVCRDLIVKLRVPTAPASQLRNSSFSCVGGFCSVAALLAAAAAAPRSRWR